MHLLSQQQDVNDPIKHKSASFFVCLFVRFANAKKSLFCVPFKTWHQSAPKELHFPYPKLVQERERHNMVVMKEQNV